MSKYYRSILTSVPFIPNQVLGLRLWLDAADANTISIETGVSEWRDKSGGNHHAIMSTTAHQPSYLNNEINGRSVVQFDGSNDRMQNSTLPLLSSVTVYVLSKANNSFGGELLQLRRRDGSRYRFICRELISSGSYFVIGDTVVVNSTIINPSGINWQVPHISKFQKIQGSSSDISYSLNGVNYNVNPSAINNESSLIEGYDLGVIQLIGGAYINNYNGQICEVLIYDNVISNDNDLLIRNYLSKKWISN
ncbi:hypothetical protein [Peijinzhouia sedimentorum]